MTSESRSVAAQVGPWGDSPTDFDREFIADTCRRLRQQEALQLRRMERLQKRLDAVRQQYIDTGNAILILSNVSRTIAAPPMPSIN